MTHWWHELLSLYLAGIGLWLAVLGVVELVAWRLRRRVKRYRVVWFSPAGVPPTWLAWERHGCEAYTAVVRATGPDAATDAIFDAYGRATGYPESYTPHVVCCKEIKSPLGDG